MKHHNKKVELIYKNKIKDRKFSAFNFWYGNKPTIQNTYLTTNDLKAFLSCFEKNYMEIRYETT